MNEIDCLTLKLLTSKKRYNNYLASANPDKSAEIREYNEKVIKNSGRIKKIIGKYLDNPETQTSNEIDDMLENCFKILLRHFDMQDFEDKCAKHGYDATDSSEEEETMFAKEEEEEEEQEEEEEEEEQEEEENKDKKREKPVSSFWGKNVNKISTLDHFIKKR
jgi:hypothetical protein